MGVAKSKRHRLETECPVAAVNIGDSLTGRSHKMKWVAPGEDQGK